MVFIDKLRIEPITQDNATDAKAIDGTFIINARLLLYSRLYPMASATR